MTTQKRIHIGTSGWHYDHWSGPFYPENLKKSEFLDYYKDRFHTSEINNSFYQLPSEKTLEAWRDAVPEGFIFSVKGSRYISHMKKLKDPQDTLPNLLERIDTLGRTLGPILFQLPPKWRFNAERLESFLKALPSDRRFAFEFRDTSWFDPKCFELLSRHNAAFCIYDMAGEVSPREVTADFVYVRLHGPSGAYQGQYDNNTLAGWAGAFSTWSDQGKEVYCYFDNDEAGFAAQDALRLQEMARG
jgi:uncharacterized protein YecE (DUF72 family)